MKKYIGWVICGIILAAAIVAAASDGIKIGEGFSVVTDFKRFKTKGAAQTDANPWNITVGVIEDSGADYVLMLPGTSLILDDLEEYTPFTFTYRLYFSSADGGDEMEVQSDGAGLLIIYYDEEGQVMREDTVFIDSHADAHCYHTIPQTAFSTYIRTIEIQCNNGYYGDGTLDWVVLQ